MKTYYLVIPGPCFHWWTHRWMNEWVRGWKDGPWAETRKQKQFVACCKFYISLSCRKVENNLICWDCPFVWRFFHFSNTSSQSRQLPMWSFTFSLYRIFSLKTYGINLNNVVNSLQKIEILKLRIWGIFKGLFPVPNLVL